MWKPALQRKDEIENHDQSGYESARVREAKGGDGCERFAQREVCWVGQHHTAGGFFARNSDFILLRYGSLAGRGLLDCRTRLAGH